MDKPYMKVRRARIFMMVLGNIVIGLGISLFKISNMGNDPYSAMVMSLANFFGMKYMHFSALFGILLFFIPLLWGRKYIGIGTIVNMLGLGYFTSFFLLVWDILSFQPSSLSLRIISMVLGLIICSLGLALYQGADVGISPFDCLPLILSDSVKNVPYSVWRILCDTSCVAIAYFTGGLVGIGALVAMFGFGPVIAFFDRFLVKKWLAKLGVA